MMNVDVLWPAAAGVGGAALKGVPLMLGALIAARLLRHRSAAARHAVWAAALGGQLLLLIASPMVPAWRAPIFRAPVLVPNDNARTAAVAPPVVDATTSAVVQRSTLPTQTVAQEPPRAIAPTADDTPVLSERVMQSLGAMLTPSVIAMLWLGGALIVFLRFLGGTAQVARAARASERVDDGEWLTLVQRTARRLGIERPLTLLRGARLTVPVTWGVVYPVVLLPVDATDWSDEQRRLVLLHEMAHVKRFDALTQLIAQAAIACFWFDPFVWYAAHRVRVEREMACDDYVLRDGMRPSYYADELLGMVRRIGTSGAHADTAFAALAMARRSEFEGRMLSILDSHTNHERLGSRASLLTIAAVLVLALPLAALRPFAAPAVRVVGPNHTLHQGTVDSTRVVVTNETRSDSAHASTTSSALSRMAAQFTKLAMPAVAQPVGDRASMRSLDTVAAHTDTIPRVSRAAADTASPTTLIALTQSDDRDMLIAVLRGVRRVQSDGDKAELLTRIAPHYLVPDDALRGAYFEAVRSITSDGDKATVLSRAVRTDLAPAAVNDLLLAARTLNSDGDKAELLKQIAVARMLTTPALRTLYVHVARTLTSDGDYRAALEALLDH